MKVKRLADLNNRLGISILLIVLISFLIGFSSYWLISILLVLLVSTITAIGIWEYAQLAIAKQLKPATYLMMIVSVLLVISFFLFLKFPNLAVLPQIIFAAGGASFFVFHFKHSESALFKVAIDLFGVLYLAVPFSLMLGILYPTAFQKEVQDGRWWLAYLILVTKITDVGAYFIGKLVGKRPLAPFLSPKKTFEGAIAGFLCAVCVSLLFYYFGHCCSSGFFKFTFFDALWLGILVGIFAQVGDLAESLLKRDAFVKDSNTLPGLGGVLDIVDSLIFTAPIIYFFIKIRGGAV